jgi:hypothetical protein
MREAVLLSFSEFIVVQCAGINGLATISRTKIRRQDFVITNKRDQRLQCSFWEPQDPSLSAKKLPAVIYCHCNSGSRLDAAEAIGIVLPMSVRVFALDFSVRPNCTADALTACSPVFHKALRSFAAAGVVYWSVSPVTLAPVAMHLPFCILFNHPYKVLPCSTSAFC